MNLIRSSMDDIQSVSCIRFIPRTNQPDYVEILNNAGCTSYVGKFGGSQPVTLRASGCLIRGMFRYYFIISENIF